MMKKLFTVWILIMASVCFIRISTFASTCNLNVEIVGEESFYGTDSLDEVVLSEKAKRIENEAFAYSSLKKISIPASVSYIADNAFEECNGLQVSAEEGSYAYLWAVKHGFIYEYTSEKDFDYEIVDGYVRITGYHGQSSELNIPCIIEELKVKDIAENAFLGCTAITSLRIPETVTTIDKNAFMNCTGIEKLVLPETCTVKSGAFVNCSELKEITMPVDLVTYGKFEGVEGVETIHYLKGATGVMPDWDGGSGVAATAYYNRLEYYSRKSLTTIDFEEGITYIGSNAYEGSYWTSGQNNDAGFVLCNVTFPSTLKSIGNGAFFYQKKLKGISLPEGIKTIGEYCFAESGLESIALPEGLEVIENDCFRDCPGLEEVILPKSMKTIGDYAFRHCTCLKSPVFHEDGSLEQIGGEAFSGCTAITSLRIPETVTTIEKNAFMNCTGIEKLVLPETCTVKSGAFVNCSELKEITMPVDLVTYGKFEGVEGVETIHYLKGATGVMPDWDGGSGVAATAYYNRLEYYSRKSLTTIDFEEGITYIGSNAYEGSYWTSGQNNDAGFVLCNVTFPSTLKSIGNGAFFYQKKLKGISLPEGIKTIGEYCFAESGLESIALPEGLEVIENDCFRDCPGLEEVILPKSMKTIGDYAFRHCTCLKSPVFHEDGSLEQIGGEAFSGCTAITSLRIPETVTTIEKNAFMNCTGIEKLVLPETCTVKSGAFVNCSELKEITMPVDLVTYGKFEGVEGVETIYYLKGATGVMPDWNDDNTPPQYYHVNRLEYYSRKSLTTIDFEEGITHIGSNAYEGSYWTSGQNNDAGFALQTVTLPDSLESIGRRAFYFLKNLKSVVMGDNCITIEDGNFEHCDNLVVTISRSCKAWFWLHTHGVKYAYGGPLKIRAIQGYEGYEDDNSRCLYLIGSASGGVAPYEKYRFVLYEDEVETNNTGWLTSKFVYMPLPNSDNFHVTAEVYDAVGNYACSDATTGVPESVPSEHETDKEAMLKAFSELINGAPVPTSLSGIMYDESLPENQWLINDLISILHLDLSVLANSSKKRAYLFREAFRAAASGSEIELVDSTKMPEAIKLLAKTGNVTASELKDSVDELCAYNQFFGSISSADSEKLMRIMETYSDMSRSELSKVLTALGYVSNQIETVSGVLKTIHYLQKFGKRVKQLGIVLKGVNAGIDLYNQLQLLLAMDPDSVRLIATSYIGYGDDIDMIQVANKLNAIADASSFEDKVAIITGGTLAELAIDELTDAISLESSMPVFKLLYAGVDWALGSGSLGDKTYELMWASDGLRLAYDAGFAVDRNAFNRNHSDKLFVDTLGSYVIYLNLAASLEEAYVDVCKVSESSPLVRTPGFVVTARKRSAKRAELLRNLAENAKVLKQFWGTGSYKTMLTIINQCKSMQTAIVNNDFSTETAGGGGSGSGW